MNATDSSFPPRDPRTRLTMAATLMGERTGKQEILIRNVSRRGIGARSRQKMPEVGERVRVRIDTFADISGTVRWAQGDQFGLSLDQDLDPAIFNARPADTHRPGIGIFDDFTPD
jgi:hypothetical protein